MMSCDVLDWGSSWASSLIPLQHNHNPVNPSVKILQCSTTRSTSLKSSGVTTRYYQVGSTQQSMSSTHSLQLWDKGLDHERQISILPNYYIISTLNHLRDILTRKYNLCWCSRPLLGEYPPIPCGDIIIAIFFQAIDTSR